jgi:hypothetical protein
VKFVFAAHGFELRRDPLVVRKATRNRSATFLRW